MDISNPNFKEAVRIGARSVDVFTQFDEFLQKVSALPLPDLCSTICNPSHLSKDRLGSDGVAYLNEYSQSEGKRSFNDPMFRLRYEEIKFYTGLVPASIREVIAKMDQSKNSR